MARYDYHCPSCQTTFEVEHPMSEHPVVLCPACGAEAQRVFSASGIRFAGSGFYNTDQRTGGSASHEHHDHGGGKCEHCGGGDCGSCS